MTLRFVDSFDHYVTADIAEKWTQNSGTTAISSSAGRRSSGAFLGPNGFSTGWITKTIDAQGTWIVGFAFKCNALPTAAKSLCKLVDGATTQVTVLLNSDGTIAAARGTSGSPTILGTTTFALSAGVFYYIEVKVLISDTVGTFEIKVDGSSKLSLTSQDTRVTGATANQVSIGGDGTPGGSPVFTYDDVYICDGAGSTNNNFLGDCRVDAYLPNGNGNSSQLTGSDGNSIDNYLLVDESAPNDDTDYVESATASQKDTYAITDMSHTPASIFGLQIVANAKKDDAGARSIATVTRSGGADTDGATQALSTSYVYYREVSETDPNTSAAWTKTNLNSAEFGVKVAA